MLAISLYIDLPDAITFLDIVSIIIPYFIHGEEKSHDT